jgi:radical SAM superfamily enzyme
MQQYETDGNRYFSIKKLEIVINTVFHRSYREGLVKYHDRNNYVQPTSGLINTTSKHIIAGKNYLTLGSTSPRVNQEPHLLVDAPS